MTSAAIDWSQFWQPILSALPALIVAFIGFIAVVFGSAGVAIRAMVKSTAGKEAAYLGMVKSNMDELKDLRKDLRESDRREMALHDEIRQVRDDGDRKLSEAIAESDQKMQAMKKDYETRIADLEKTIDTLQTELDAKETELEKERKARKDAELARDLAEMQRDKNQQNFEKKIGQLESQISALQKQVTKAADSEVKSSGE